MPWDLDALMVGVGTHGGVKVKVGVDTGGVRVKIPFKRPKTRVQGVVDLCSMWCWFLPSSGSVLPGWWCAWGKRMWCRV